MSSLALGAAFAAVQLVHQAHSKVKTSKARCARLVERCQLVVDRLERIAETKGGDAIIRERIHELERAFEHTARIIAQVGQQGIIVSLLQSESNALRIESCNDTLTELISLFNLEGMVDVRRWQSDLEVARVRDHRELLNLGRRIESENAAINRELAQQGATITEVLRVIHDINAGLQNAHFVPGTVKVAMPVSATPPDAGSRKTLTLRMSFDRGRDDNEDSRRCRPPVHAIAAATSPPVPVPVPVRTAKMTESDSGTSKSSVPCGSYTSPKSASAATKSKSATRTPRHHLRLSESLTQKCVKMVPLANVVFSKLSSSSRSPSYSSPLHGTATRSASGDLLCGRLPGLKTVSSAICDEDDDEDEDDVRSFALSSSWCHLPVEPPPPYQLRVANPGPECGCPMEGGAGDVGHDAAVMSSSRITTASVEAIRAPDSPVPVLPSPKLSTDSVFGSTRSLASVSSGRSGTNPGPHYRTPRNSASGHTGPMLRRRDTIIFARRVTMSSGHSNVVEPIIRPL